MNEYRIHLNERKNPGQYVFKKSILPEIMLAFLLSLQQVVFVVFVHVDTAYSSSSHKKCLLFQKMLDLLQSTERHSDLFTVTPLKSLIFLTTAAPSSVPTAKNPEV
jgi:hypothetical protein